MKKILVIFSILLCTNVTNTFGQRTMTIVNNYSGSSCTLIINFGAHDSVHYNSCSSLTASGISYSYGTTVLSSVADLNGCATADWSGTCMGFHADATTGVWDFATVGFIGNPGLKLMNSCNGNVGSGNVYCGSVSHLVSWGDDGLGNITVTIN